MITFNLAERTYNPFVDNIAILLNRLQRQLSDRTKMRKKLNKMELSPEAPGLPWQVSHRTANTADMLHKWRILPTDLLLNILFHVGSCSSRSYAYFASEAGNQTSWFPVLTIVCRSVACVEDGRI